MDFSIVGYLAGFFTTLAVLPQLIHTIKTGSTGGVSFLFLFIILIGVFLWTVYGFLIDDFPMIFFNLIATIMWAIVFSYKVKNIFFKI